MLPVGSVLGALDFNVLLMIAGTMGLVQLFIDSQMPNRLVDLLAKLGGGNCTPIGASAHIAGIGILRKAGYEVKNGDFFRIGIPFTFAAIVPAYIYIWLIYGV